MSQVVSGAVGTYVEIHPEGLDIDLAVRRESNAVNAEKCLVGESHEVRW